MRFGVDSFFERYLLNGELRVGVLGKIICLFISGDLKESSFYPFNMAYFYFRNWSRNFMLFSILFLVTLFESFDKSWGLKVRPSISLLYFSFYLDWIPIKAASFLYYLTLLNTFFPLNRSFKEISSLILSRTLTSRYWPYRYIAWFFHWL